LKFCNQWSSHATLQRGLVSDLLGYFQTFEIHGVVVVVDQVVEVLVAWRDKTRVGSVHLLLGQV
jgi:hypothetical protein